MSMIICKNCGKVASWNYHFQSYMCLSCHHRYVKTIPEGVWYLTYVVFDNLENRLFNAICVEKIRIDAVNRERAYEKARRKWNDIFQETYNGETYRGWDGVEYPHSPKVIFEVEVFEEDYIKEL